MKDDARVSFLRDPCHICLHHFDKRTRHFRAFLLTPVAEPWTGDLGRRLCGSMVGDIWLWLLVSFKNVSREDPIAAGRRGCGKRKQFRLGRLSPPCGFSSLPHSSCPVCSVCQPSECMPLSVYCPWSPLPDSKKWGKEESSVGREGRSLGEKWSHIACLCSVASSCPTLCAPTD